MNRFESGEATNAISDSFKTFISDLLTSSREKWGACLLYVHLQREVKVDWAKIDKITKVFSNAYEAYISGLYAPSRQKIEMRASLSWLPDEVKLDGAKSS